jgi:opacity protein-like surface antigen
MVLRFDQSLDINVLQEKIMKKLRISFSFILLVIAIGSAQESSDIEISLSGGFAFPSSPMSFSDYWKMQYGGGIGAGIALSQSITISGNIEYFQFTLDNDGLTEGFDTKYMRDIWVFNNVSLKPSADPSSVMTLSTNMRIVPSELSGSLSPYFITGTGVMIFSLSEISLPTKSIISVDGSDITMVAKQRIIGGDETVPFVQFGMGLDYRLTESLNIFVEGRYSRGLNKGIGTTYVPLVVGVKFRM